MTASLRPHPLPLSACTIARDLARFDRLIEEMEAELGESWGDIALDDAAAFLASDQAAGLRFVILALDQRDAGNPAVPAAILAAREAGLRVMLVAQGMGTVQMQDLLRLSPDDVLTYPIPHGALREVARRTRLAEPSGLGPADDLAPAARRPDRAGITVPVIGVAGGVGATTLAINLAWELGERHRVCLIDLDAHSGSVAAYLALDSAVPSAFPKGLQLHRNRFHVLIAAPSNVGRMIAAARTGFDFVLLDLPTGDHDLAAQVLPEADLALAVMEPDARSARNALRLARDAPPGKLRHVMNRAPGPLSLAGRAKMRRIAASVPLAAVLPDGGARVAAAGESASPLAETAPRNRYRQAVLSLARQLPVKRS